MADGQHTTTAPRVDWDRLRAAALAATEHAYVPYSGFRVGAAALTDDGRLVSGCSRTSSRCSPWPASWAARAARPPRACRT